MKNINHIYIYEYETNRLNEKHFILSCNSYKSNVNLHLEKDATLLFSDNPADYLPAVHTTWEGMECYNYSPLIYAYECENIAITGEGKLEAKMDTWKKWFSYPRGRMNSMNGN